MKQINRDNTLMQTPLIPFSVYQQLPLTLSQCVRPFEDGRERDVMLTSSITILSGCFSACRGQYGNHESGPNLFAFIVAPPASGKGTMKYAQLLGKSIQDKYLEANQRAKQDYEARLKLLQKELKMNKDGNAKVPERPKYPVLYLPGNSSAAAIYNKLVDSDGVGIICETEADTLTQAIKQDWGNFSDLLRKAFHHETLTMNRATNDVYISIEEPHLSVLLTGTPDQVPKLISSAEDGLCSRFLFYCYSREPQWIDPRPCLHCTDIPDMLKVLSRKVEAIVAYLDDNECRFTLTEEQFNLLNENFEAKLERIKEYEGAVASVVFRLGLIAYRIAMVLTIIRKMDNPDGLNVLECSDDDLITTLQMTDVYFEHALVMYALLPRNPKAAIKPKLKQFYALLPQNGQVQRKEANEIGQSLGLSERTVGYYITELKDSGLIVGANGKFEKVPET